MITTKGSTQHSVFGLQMRGDHDARHRETIAHTFCHRIDIRIYTGEVLRKEFSAPAVAALYAVSNEYAAIFFRQPADSLQEGDLGDIDPTYALDAFDDHRGDLVTLFFKTFFKCSLIIKGEEDNIFGLVHR